MSVYSFGFGGFGSLGTGELTNLHSPSEVPDIACLNVTHISVSLWHSLIITDTGRLYSLGRGRYGALGLGDDAGTYIHVQILILQRHHSHKAYSSTSI